jgi:hypothetical protein
MTLSEGDKADVIMVAIALGMCLVWWLLMR